MEKITTPEDLHNVGKGKKSPTTDKFVNNNAEPMVKLSDLADPEVSKTATEKLRTSLTKNR